MGDAKMGMRGPGCEDRDGPIVYLAVEHLLPGVRHGGRLENLGGRHRREPGAHTSTGWGECWMYVGVGPVWCQRWSERRGSTDSRSASEHEEEGGRGKRSVVDRPG